MVPIRPQLNGSAVAVVTVSYGSSSVLPAFLRSVAAASEVAAQVVIVDNLGGDEKLAALAAETGSSVLLRSDNPGYGGGVNAGIASLPPTIEWVVIVNPDVEFGSGSIDIMIEAAREDSAIGSVGPAIVTDGAVYPSARAVPSIRTGVGHALFANIWLENPWTRAYRRDAETTPHRRDAGWLSGACLLVRRSAFDAIGGFDDGYFMYFEDVDLGYRMTQAGFRNVYEPEARVTHSGAHSTAGESAKMISAHHDSARRFLSRKYSRRILFPVRLALGLGLRVRSAALQRRASRR